MNTRIIVIGDLHTDLQQLVFILQARGAVDSSGAWTGGNTWVVCMGDIFDGLRPDIRPDSEYLGSALELRLVDYILQLDTQARKESGRVLSIMGNHDVCAHMGVNSMYHKRADIQSFKDRGTDRQRELAPGGALITKLAKEWPMILRIGRFVFVHGSLEPRLLEATKGKGLEKIDKLNRDLVRFLRDGREASWMDRSFNPLFSRYFTQENQQTADDLRKTFSLLDNKVDTMFLGHTIFPEVTGLFHNRVICTDVALSRAFGSDSPVEIIEIRDGVICRVKLKRS
uniref:Calcineurin-like phosphoesterase domain-containing protein n=1 Tax=viral metagenome TaxID=1070528 RepID=A0A6C0KDF7_9ZZZZ